MSFAVHLFVTEEFSQKSHESFLAAAQNLFGHWHLKETVPFNQDRQDLTIHESWIMSEDVTSPDYTRVNIEAYRHLEHVPLWTYDYQWHLLLETGAARTPVGLAVQLGAWLLAMHRFRYSLALDRDSSLKDEPTEFRSVESVAEHVKRVIYEECKCSADLIRRGLLDERGFLKGTVGNH